MTKKASPLVPTSEDYRTEIARADSINRAERRSEFGADVRHPTPHLVTINQRNAPEFMRKLHGLLHPYTPPEAERPNRPEQE